MTDHNPKKLGGFLEVVIWASLVLIVLVRKSEFGIFGGKSISRSFLDDPYLFISALILLTIPFIVKRIFGFWPIQGFIESYNEFLLKILSSVNEFMFISEDETGTTLFRESRRITYKKISEMDPSLANGKALLAYQCWQYKEFSERIFNRSGVYLLLGSVIAIVGVVFFSMDRISFPGGIDLAAAIMWILPHFGVLFFIELIAFFFLRQYRAALDEYRYYERILRSREEALLAYLVIEASDDRSSLLEAVKSDRKSTRLNSSHSQQSRMPSSA